MTDLDARVAALENLVAVLCDPEGKCRISGSDADRAIVDESLAALRAELQKPALHEGVTGAEINQAVHLVHGRLALRNVEKCVDMKRALESFLQGRAQPAQEEITRPILSDQLILDAAERAGLWPNTVHHWLPAFHRYHAELDATFRASKGEKT